MIAATSTIEMWCGAAELTLLSRLCCHRAVCRMEWTQEKYVDKGGSLHLVLTQNTGRESFTRVGQWFAASGVENRWNRYTSRQLMRSIVRNWGRQSIDLICDVDPLSNNDCIRSTAEVLGVWLNNLCAENAGQVALIVDLDWTIELTRRKFDKRLYRVSGSEMLHAICDESWLNRLSHRVIGQLVRGEYGG